MLILGLVTRQLFNLVWALIQANWARKLTGDNKPMVLVAMYPAGMVAGVLTMVLYKDAAALGGLFIIAGAIVYLFGVFSIKAAMEEYYNSTENISFSAPCTFSTTLTGWRVGRKPECLRRTNHAFATHTSPDPRRATAAELVAGLAFG